MLYTNNYIAMLDFVRDLLCMPSFSHSFRLSLPPLYTYLSSQYVLTDGLSCSHNSRVDGALCFCSNS
jgi:hypothetical protein